MTEGCVSCRVADNTGVIKSKSCRGVVSEEGPCVECAALLQAEDSILLSVEERSLGMLLFVRACV